MRLQESNILIGTASSALDQFAQGSKECGVGDRSALAPSNQRLSLSPQRCNAERHCDAMIAERINLGAVKSLSAGNPHSVLTLFNLRSHGTQINGDCGNAIRFFYAQFFRVAHLNSLFRERRDRRKHGSLADQSRRIGTGEHGSLQASALDLYCAYKFAVSFL